MAEYTTIAAGHAITYEGYVDIGSYWAQIRRLFEKRGYAYFEREHNEVVARDGKEIFLKADSDRELSDDAKSRITVQLQVRNSKEVTIELDGKPKRVNECTMKITTSAYLVTDYEGRYQHVASLFFLRRIYEKFFGVRELKKLTRVVQRDYEDIIKETKHYLNLSKY